MVRGDLCLDSSPTLPVRTNGWTVLWPKGLRCPKDKHQQQGDQVDSTAETLGLFHATVGADQLHPAAPSAVCVTNLKGLVFKGGDCRSSCACQATVERYWKLLSWGLVRDPTHHWELATALLL